MPGARGGWSGFGNNKPATEEQVFNMALKGRRETRPGVFGSRPGAPNAVVNQGLKTPTSAMGASSWANTFRTTAPATQRQALTERLGSGADFTKPETYSGISSGVVDSIMGPGHWGRVIGQDTPTGSTPSATATPTFSAGSRLPFGASTIGVPAGAPMIASKYGYAVNRAPSFLWSKAFAQNMNGNG